MFCNESTQSLVNVQQYMVTKLLFERNQMTQNQKLYKEKESADLQYGC